MTNSTQKPAKDPAQVKQEKRDAFLKVAPGRVDRALNSISLIGNLGGTAYDYEPVHAEKIIAALREAVNRTETRLKREALAKPEGFTFS